MLLLPASLTDQLKHTNVFEGIGKYKSQVRFSSLYPGHMHASLRRVLYIHSAYPTEQNDAVFFGPDTYLFMRFISSVYSRYVDKEPRVVIDVACGGGAGAIHLALSHGCNNLIGLDLNPAALALASINAEAAGYRKIKFIESDLFKAVADRKDVDLIISNPPYIASTQGDGTPMYADGGDSGLQLPLRIAEEGLDLLDVGGILIIYTGVPISIFHPEEDKFLERLKGLTIGEILAYEIIHPDVFGEELDYPAYAEVGRIQVVGAVVRKLPADNDLQPLQ